MKTHWEMKHFNEHIPEINKKYIYSPFQLRCTSGIIPLTNDTTIKCLVATTISQDDHDGVW